MISVVTVSTQNTTLAGFASVLHVDSTQLVRTLVEVQTEYDRIEVVRDRSTKQQLCSEPVRKSKMGAYRKQASNVRPRIIDVAKI